MKMMPAVHKSLKHRLKHFFYAAGWKKFEPVWNFLIKTEGLNRILPILESILSKVEPGKKYPQTNEKLLTAESF